MVTRQAATSLSGIGNLTAEVMQEAISFCGAIDNGHESVNLRSNQVAKHHLQLYSGRAPIQLRCETRFSWALRSNGRQKDKEALFVH